MHSLYNPLLGRHVVTVIFALFRFCTVICYNLVDVVLALRQTEYRGPRGAGHSVQTHRCRWRRSRCRGTGRRRPRRAVRRRRAATGRADISSRHPPPPRPATARPAAPTTTGRRAGLGPLQPSALHSGVRTAHRWLSEF